MNELDYISDTIHPQDVLTIVHLFFPKILQHKGKYFLEDCFEQSTFDAIRSQNADNLEYEMNKTIVYDLFAYAPNDVSKEVYDKLSRVLKKSWEAHLLSFFPDKQFDVVLLNEAVNYGPILTFHQIEND